jgi:hypothetical protein
VFPTVTGAGGFLSPPAIKAAVLIPADAPPFLAVFKSPNSVQVVPL